ncbi:MAG: tetratricopeptide repeat protein [Chloroflexota bacterium]
MATQPVNQPETESEKQPQLYTNFFQQHILNGVDYWCTHAAVQTIDVPVLDEKRENILKAISLGLGVDEAWPLVRQLIIDLATYMERRGFWDVWHVMLERAIVTAQRVSDLDGETTLTALLARVCQRESQLAETVRYYRRVIKLARQTGNRYEEARACSNLGFLYIESGYWWRSEVLSGRALAIFDKLENMHGQAHTHNHLGCLYTRQCHWKQAQGHLKLACDIWRDMDDKHGLMRGNENLGVLYNEVKKADDAIIHLNKALQYAELVGDEAQRGFLLNNLGIAYRDKQNLDLAENYVKEAEAIFDRASNQAGLTLVWWNLGLIQKEQEQWDAAIKSFEQSLANSYELKNFHGVIDLLLELIESEVALENRLQATIRFDELQSILVLHKPNRQHVSLLAKIKDCENTMHQFLV